MKFSIKWTPWPSACRNRAVISWRYRWRQLNTDVITIRGDVDVDVVLRYLRMKVSCRSHRCSLCYRRGKSSDWSSIVNSADHRSGRRFCQRHHGRRQTKQLRSIPKTQTLQACSSVVTGYLHLWLMKTSILLAVSPSMTWLTLSVKMQSTRWWVWPVWMTTKIPSPCCSIRS